MCKDDVIPQAAFVVGILMMLVRARGDEEVFRIPLHRDKGYRDKGIRAEGVGKEG